MVGMHIDSCQAAGERFFRLYSKHCVRPDVDTLFNLLNSIHSLNDKLNGATGKNFFDNSEFVALKALRNLFHHEIELINEIRLIPVNKLPAITTDLLFLCLVPSRLVVSSFEKIEKKRRVREENVIRNTLKWYNTVVNINPCIFNFAVHTYQKLMQLGLELRGAEYLDFQSSYEFEEENGYSHFVTGDIGCHAGSVEKLLEVAFASVI